MNELKIGGFYYDTKKDFPLVGKIVDYDHYYYHICFIGPCTNYQIIIDRFEAKSFKKVGFFATIWYSFLFFLYKK